MSRRLIGTERRVDRRREDAYLAAWERLADRVREEGAHAWLFRADDEPDRFVEFLEFEGSERPTERPEVDAARRLLDEAFEPETVREWLGVRT